MNKQAFHIQAQVLDAALLQRIAEKVGTPFWLYDGGLLRRRIEYLKHVAGPDVQLRFAMKACSAARVLKEMQARDIWIDAVSGNEVLRARAAGYSGGANPPRILFTSDVFRDNSLDVVLKERILPNLGSPAMLQALQARQYAGPIALRLNPGFGHGHVNACDTGGPSSKHGLWMDDVCSLAAEAAEAGMHVILLHAHIGSGPQLHELAANLRRLAGEFARALGSFPGIEAVSLGGGIPHNYRSAEQIDLTTLGPILKQARDDFSEAAGRTIRVEMEPGRYFVAPVTTLVTRVMDVKATRTNEKGKGHRFVMVDAGFVDLVRPAMYGSYHRISLAGKENQAAGEDYIVAGPLCESGDVFTRDDKELLAPRALPKPAIGDLLLLHDAGAYGYAMSSNYNSVGRAPQVWLEEDGAVDLISRRETVDDLVRSEVQERLV